MSRATVGSVLELSRGNRHSADFQWRFPGSEAGIIERGVRWLDSPRVSFAGRGWELELGPVRDPSSEEFHLSLYRCPGESPAPVVRYWMGERTGDEEEEDEEIGRGTMGDRYQRSVPHPWLRLSDIRRRRERSAPSSDTISISLRLRTGPETNGEMECLASDKSTQTELKDTLILKEHLKKLLLHASDHDVTFKVKGKEFKAHKSMLRVRSPVFEAMFKHPMRENEEDSVTVEDVDPECFGVFLEYVYTGEVEGLSAADATALYYAADKYDFPALKRSCVDVLRASLSTTLVCDVIALAATHEEEELLESTMAYVTDHLVQIKETVEWQRFAVRNPILASEVSLKAIKRHLPSDPQ